MIYFDERAYLHCIGIQGRLLPVLEAYFQLIKVAKMIDDGSPKSRCHRVGNNELILTILEALFLLVSETSQVFNRVVMKSHRLRDTKQRGELQKKNALFRPYNIPDVNSPPPHPSSAQTHCSRTKTHYLCPYTLVSSSNTSLPPQTFSSH